MKNLILTLIAAIFFCPSFAQKNIFPNDYLRENQQVIINNSLELNTSSYMNVIYNENIVNDQQTKKNDFKDFQTAHIITGAFGLSAFSYLVYSTHPKFKNFSRSQVRMLAFGTTIGYGLVTGFFNKKGLYWKNMKGNLIGAIAFQATLTVPIHIQNKKYRKRYKNYKKFIPTSNEPSLAFSRNKL